MSGLKQKVVKGTLWVLLEKLSTQGVGFVVTLVLARLLTPGDYGTVALLSIFIVIANVLVDSGFGQSLVQKKEVTELDFNSVFYMSLALSGILYAVLFFLAPCIAAFYRTPELIPILRVTAIGIIFAAVNSVQNAELNRKMLFHLSFRISLISVLCSAAVGLTCAFLRLGPWALVWQNFTLGLVGMITRWFFIAWRPRWMFSFTALKGLWQFGWKLGVSNLIASFFANLYGLLIGRVYTRADLAFVQKGSVLPSLVMNNVNESLGRVAFPAMSQMQDDPVRLREAMRRMLMTSTFLVFPLMVGIGVCSEPIIQLLYGYQWLPAVPFAMITCFDLALWPIHTTNLQVITALGRSDVFLILEIVKKILVVLSMFAFYRLGVWGFVFASVMTLGPISAVLNAIPNHRLLKYPVWRQFCDILPASILALVMGGVIYGIGALGKLWISPYLEVHVSLVTILFVQVFIGVVVYLGSAYCLKLKAFGEFVELWQKVRMKVGK